MRKSNWRAFPPEDEHMTAQRLQYFAQLTQLRMAKITEHKSTDSQLCVSEGKLKYSLRSSSFGKFYPSLT
jgi:hypothetical protein